MLDLDDLCAAACARLKHSVGTSAGMHKRQLRLKAEAMRKDAALRLPEPVWDFVNGGAIASPDSIIEYISPRPVLASYVKDKRFERVVVDLSGSAPAVLIGYDFAGKVTSAEICDSWSIDHGDGSDAGWSVRKGA